MRVPGPAPSDSPTRSTRYRSVGAPEIAAGSDSRPVARSVRAEPIWQDAAKGRPARGPAYALELCEMTGPSGRTRPSRLRHHVCVGTDSRGLAPTSGSEEAAGNASNERHCLRVRAG